MKSIIQLKPATSQALIALALLYFGLLPQAQALVPPPDGGYPNFNTAEGQNALFSLTTGSANTAVGWFSLWGNTAGSFNTATGVGALLFNTADENTAFGAAALLSNRTGEANTAVGAAALANNTKGTANTATGLGVLHANTEGMGNTAIGASALAQNTTGDNNTAIGALAGTNQSTGSSNVYIGVGVLGVAGESNACYIGSIFGQTSASGLPVLINSDNKLGTATSSNRFKEEIKPMDRASEALLTLKPVTFRYKKEIDPAGTSQFGLVAEDVENVNPDLVVHDKEGKPYSVRYDQINAMLLNEFLKEHRKVEKLEANDAERQSEIKALVATVKEQAAQIQKVSAQLEVSKPAQQVVNNN
jgi:Chaperone of endosialidase